MKKKYFILFICSVIFIAVISITLVIFSNSNKNDTNEKVGQEIDYIETKLIGMVNSLNNVTFSNSVLLEQNTIKGQESSNLAQGSSGDNNSDNSQQKSSNGQSDQSQSQSSSQSQNEIGTDYSKYSVENQNILIQQDTDIDWSYLKNTVEIIYSSWPTIMIDLHSINIKNENIIEFSNTLDTLIVNIEKEDKRLVLDNLAKLYSLLPVFIEQFSNDTDKINCFYTKSCIVNAYVFLEEDNWDEIKTQITKASEYFNIIMNSTNNDRQQSNISKTYIAINEMNNVIDLKDKKLFYLKYINLMESIMQI